MDAPIVTQTFSLNTKEYLSCAWWQRSGRRILPAWALFAILDVALSWRIGILDPFGSKLVAGLIAAVLLYLVLYRYFSARWNVSRSKLRQFFGPRIVEVSNESVSVRYPNGMATSVPWDHFKSAEQRREFLSLVIGPRTLLTIDLKAVSPSDRDTLLRFVSSKFKIGPVPWF